MLTADLLALAETDAPFGPYRLISLIGRGGMAEVWRGLVLADDGTSSAVAVKRILPHLCDELAVVEMFLSEARIAMQLVHPNLVRTHNAGLVKGQPFIAMELLEGADLWTLSRSSAELPVGLVLAIVRDVCAALVYLHSFCDGDGQPLGLIHRDISPANVIVQRDGSVKLLDFGIVKAGLAGGVPRTEIGQIKGKLGYVAPEMLRHGRYDQRADLFAVGVVLWELLTRRRLFEASDESLRLWLNAQCEVAPPSTWRPQLSPALDALVLRALARDPDQRYPSAAALAHELDERLAAEPWSTADTIAWMRAHAPAARATPPPADWQLAPPARARRRWPLVAGAALAVTLAGAATVVRAPGLHASAPAPSAPSPPSPSSVPLPGVVVSAAGDAWARPGGLRAIASSDVTLTSAAPLPPAAVAARAKATPTAKPRHGATTSSHKVAHRDELDKVIGQTGLIDVYSSSRRARR
jgi:hypothetical protein